MAFVSELVDQLRDLLTDPADTQVPYAQKKLYLNRGIARLWPRVYRVVEEVLISDGVTVDWDLASATSAGHIISVRRETANTSAKYVRYDDYDIIEGDEDSVVSKFVFTESIPAPGVRVRIRYAAAPSLIVAASYAASQSETWVGPDRAMNLPVLYAMGMIAARKLDDRQDTNRYSTIVAENGVTDDGLMRSSQMWFTQFDLELEDMSRPLPPARD